MHFRRGTGRTSKSAILLGLGFILSGCSVAPSPTRAAIERGDSQAAQTEERLAPMANNRRGLLVAGDGFGRMAYSGEPTVSTVSVDDDSRLRP